MEQCERLIGGNAVPLHQDAFCLTDHVAASYSALQLISALAPPAV